tara:strand:+ start:651 stop:806 length:156 start_codon:yes stop_codon:yes gene_type:complete
MKQAKKYLEDGVDLEVFFTGSKITFEDLEQLVLDTYNDAWWASKNDSFPTI